MEIRCGSCSKLFRVADDKITGSGIKFKCTRCGEYVKITREDFERYNLSKAAAPGFPSLEPAAPATATFGTTQPEVTGREPMPEVPPVTGPEPVIPPAVESPYTEPASPTTKPTSEPEPWNIPPTEQPEATVQETAPEAPPVTVPEQPEAPIVAASYAEELASLMATPEPGHGTQAESAEKPMQEEKEAGVFKPDAPQPSAPSISGTERLTAPARPTATAADVIAAAPLARPSSGKKYLIIALSVIILAVAAFFILRAAGYNVFHFTRSASKTEQATKVMTSPEGLQITSAQGSLDQNHDLVVSGMVSNTTDKEKAAWYILVDVYDAQGTVLVKARMLNGKQLYTKRDYEILAKRGVNIQELKAHALQNPGVVIPPKGSVPFEIHFLEPPIGIASFYASLQPFDPEQLFKEIAEEQK